MRRVKKVAENEVMDVRNPIPATFDYMKNVAVAVLSILACTFSCESFFSVTKFVMSKDRVVLLKKTVLHD
jgi:hypothetical protein